jgi:hypothetical protein
MTDPTTATIARLRELDAAATPVPWAADEWYCSDSEGGWAGIGPHHHAETDNVDDGPDGPLHEAAKADAALIAAMRNALPALLAQLAAQAAEIERLRSIQQDIGGIGGCADGSGMRAVAVVADANRRADKAEAARALAGAELEEARAALRKIAEHVGAGVGAECSHRFHLLVEDEVRLVVAQLRGTRDKAEARVEKLEALLLAVKCGEFSGITCDNVNGRCWFDARDAALAKREGGR